MHIMILYRALIRPGRLEEHVILEAPDVEQVPYLVHSIVSVFSVL